MRFQNVPQWKRTTGSGVEKQAGSVKPSWPKPPVILSPLCHTTMSARTGICSLWRLLTRGRLTRPRRSTSSQALDLPVQGWALNFPFFRHTSGSHRGDTEFNPPLHDLLPAMDCYGSSHPKTETMQKTTASNGKFVIMQLTQSNVYKNLPHIRNLCRLLRNLPAAGWAQRGPGETGRGNRAQVSNDVRSWAAAQRKGAQGEWSRPRKIIFKQVSGVTEEDLGLTLREDGI